MTTQEPKAFMYHLPITEHQYLVDKLIEYKCPKYLVAHEKTPYSHFHLVAWMTLKEYNNYNKHIINKYNLKANSKNGQTKQYGKETKIRNLERMMTYTVKDGNVKTSLTTEQLQLYIDKSYKKDEKHKFEKEVIEYINDYFKLTQTSYHAHKVYGNNGTEYLDYLDKESIVKHLIIEYMIIKDFKFNKTTIMNYYILWVRRSCDIKDKKDLNQTTRHIYQNLFGTPTFK